jgi:hypothetical protein
VRRFRAAYADGGQRALHFEGFGVLLDYFAGNGAEGALRHLEQRLARALASVIHVLVEAHLGAFAHVQHGLVEELDGPARALGCAQGIALEYRAANGQRARTLRPNGRDLSLDRLCGADFLRHGALSSRVLKNDRRGRGGRGTLPSTCERTNPNTTTYVDA